MTDVKASENEESNSTADNEFSWPDQNEIIDFEAERLHRKQRLAAGLRVLGRLRLAEGVAGHITVRDPEFPDRFWVNPFGKNFKLMKVSDLICVDHTGEVVEGDQPVTAAAFAMQLDPMSWPQLIVTLCMEEHFPL